MGKKEVSRKLGVKEKKLANELLNKFYILFIKSVLNFLMYIIKLYLFFPLSFSLSVPDNVLSKLFRSIHFAPSLSVSSFSSCLNVS